MCGFAGTVDFEGRTPPPSRERLLAMATAVGHRGPDEYGIYRDDLAGIAHARLSLVDIAAGQQPMGDEDGTGDWLAFNGEIFNHVELRDELVAAGRRFRTRSDTEVVLQAYAEWGTACFERFNGQWAIALWNPGDQELVLARDHAGICPLYVYQRGRRVWFASEVKGLYVDPDVPRALDPAGIDQTFTYWAPLAPVTAFAGVEELHPGTCRIYRARSQPQDVTYWEPSFRAAGDGEPMTIEDATEQFTEVLADATRLRLIRADVPVGAYLSGGLDSSVIARLAHDHAAGELSTFSMVFEDAEFDESEFQQLMAATLRSRHETIVIRNGEIARVFPDVVFHAERPLLRTAPAPLFLLSQFVRDRGIKAVLTGEGADEVLAGYDLFREFKIRRFWSRQPESTTRPLLFDRIYPYLARSPARAKGMAHSFWRLGLDRIDEPGASHRPRWMTTAALKRLYSPEFRQSVTDARPPDVLDTLPAAFSGWEPLAQAQYLEWRTLLTPYIISSQGDRMLMANSVEGRFPFLDRRVVDLCNSLPAQYKLARLDEKHLLKRAARGLVPPEVLQRKKQAYRAPDAAAFTSRGRLDESVVELLSARSIEDAGIFDPGAVTGLLAKVDRLARKPDHTFGNSDNMAIVGIVSTQLLHRQFVSARRPPSTAPVDVAVDIDRTTNRHRPKG